MNIALANRYRLAGVFGAVLIGLLSATPAQAARFCDGEPATIQRGAGNNTVTGTEGPDVIVLGGGDDLAHALGGRDRVCGEDGVDAIGGGAGGDPLLSGGPGRDFVEGVGGNDTVAGDDGRDGGQTTWRGGQGFAAGLQGSAGDDTVLGGPGDDGDGFSTFTYDGLAGGTGDDDLFGGQGDDDIEDPDGPNSAAAIDIDRVFGGDGDDEATTQDGDGKDLLDCGPQGDNYSVIYDPRDEVNCE
jgi:hypothetical protein